MLPCPFFCFVFAVVSIVGSLLLYTLFNLQILCVIDSSVVTTALNPKKKSKMVVSPYQLEHVNAWDLSTICCGWTVSATISTSA